VLRPWNQELKTMSSMHGKVAIVTGGAGGIGTGIARRLSAEGCTVVVSYFQSRDAAEALIAEIVESGGRGAALPCDVRSADQVAVLFAEVVRRFGRVDLLANNAGTIVPTLVAEAEDVKYDAVFDVNVRGALHVLREAARHLADGGRIVSTSSTMVGAPIASGGLYAASKGALEGLSRAFAREVGTRGITVNAIRVGPTIPGMFAKAPPERQSALAASSPFKRLGAPRDVADVVAFLLSEEARWITGQVLSVDGGAL
jgi:3-oxoacyl-[acyl-carrier protein] reductase